MSKQIKEYLVRMLVEEDPSGMDDVLLTALFYVETWLRGSTSGPEPELEKLLEIEVIDASDVQELKTLLVRLGSQTNSSNVLSQVVGILRSDGDKELAPLYQAWLISSTEELLKHSSVMYQCMHGLNDCGRKIFSTNSHSISEVDANLKDSMKYIREKMGVTLGF